MVPQNNIVTDLQDHKETNKKMKATNWKSSKVWNQ